MKSRITAIDHVQIIKQRGVEIIPEPIQPDGLRRFFLCDPAGNRIEIGQRG